MKHEIKSKKEYHQTMVEVYDLMSKGERNLSECEMNRLSVLAE